MKLIIPLIALFVFVGLTKTALNRRLYIQMIAIILVVTIYYYFTSIGSLGGS